MRHPAAPTYLSRPGVAHAVSINSPCLLITLLVFVV